MFNPSDSTLNLTLKRGVNLSPFFGGQFVRLFHLVYCFIPKSDVELRCSGGIKQFKHAFSFDVIDKLQEDNELFSFGTRNMVIMKTSPTLFVNNWRK